MEELKFITKLLSALSPDNQTELIKALKDVCKQALDVSENLGSNGIEAAKESINHTFDNIKDSVRTISDNKTKRETLEIVTNGQIRLVQLSTMKELFEIAQRDSPEQAMMLFQSQLHQPIELKKVEEQGKNARIHDVINGLKDITTDILDTIAPIKTVRSM